jgi:hypothetical protein
LVTRARKESVIDYEFNNKKLLEAISEIDNLPETRAWMLHPERFEAISSVYNDLGTESASKQERNNRSAKYEERMAKIKKRAKKLSELERSLNILRNLPLDIMNTFKIPQKAKPVVLDYINYGVSLGKPFSAYFLPYEQPVVGIEKDKNGDTYVGIRVYRPRDLSWLREKSSINYIKGMLSIAFPDDETFIFDDLLPSLSNTGLKDTILFRQAITYFAKKNMNMPSKDVKRLLETFGVTGTESKHIDTQVNRFGERFLKNP